MKVCTKLLYCMMLMLCCIGVSAWNGTEHRIAAYIAQEHLNPNTVAVLEKYLDQSIVEYSTWMDRYRKSEPYKQTDVWHMVSISEDGKSFVEPGQARGLAAHALRKAVDILENFREHDDSTVYINILYVLHLVPEIHCPGHYYFYSHGGADGAQGRTFQTISLNGRNVNYHALWDGAITALHPKLNLDQYKNLYDVTDPELQKKYCAGSVEDWMLGNASEIFPIYDWAFPGSNLDDSFLITHRELPEKMIAAAGCRLAFLLNSLFGDGLLPSENQAGTAEAAEAAEAAAPASTADNADSSGCHKGAASDIAALKASLQKEENILAEGTRLRGIVISDYSSPNSETNPNIAWNKVDIALSLRTLYIQDEDGRQGARVVLESLYSNKFSRGTEVEMDLGGCIAEKDELTGALTIHSPKSIKVEGRTEEVYIKEKSISELCDEDIYTLVRIRDVEFLNKQGSFLNIYEACAQQSNINILDPTFRACDSWASLLLDPQGDHIFMQLNSRLDWRRNNLDFPKGRGKVTGVVVSGQNRRYGADFGRYSLRPIFRSDIDIPLEQDSAYRTLTAFRWDRNYHQELKLFNGGSKRWMGRKDIKDDAVRADVGDGLLYTDSGAYLSLDTEYDARHASDGSGMGARAAAALRLDGECTDWYVFRDGKPSGTRSIILETSTVGAQGQGLVFNFSMLAGNHSVQYSYGFPSLWTVTYSTDGRKFLPTGFSFMLKPIAWNRSLYMKKFYPTSYDAAMGFPEFSIKLPEGLLGQEKLFIRISPVGDIITELHADPDAPIASGRISPGFDHPYCIRIGMAELKVF